MAGFKVLARRCSPPRASPPSCGTGYRWPPQAWRSPRRSGSGRADGHSRAPAREGRCANSRSRGLVAGRARPRLRGARALRRRDDRDLRSAGGARAGPCPLRHGKKYQRGGLVRACAPSSTACGSGGAAGRLDGAWSTPIVSSTPRSGGSSDRQRLAQIFDHFQRAGASLYRADEHQLHRYRADGRGARTLLAALASDNPQRRGGRDAAALGRRAAAAGGDSSTMPRTTRTIFPSEPRR